MTKYIILYSGSNKASAYFALTNYNYTSIDWDKPGPDKDEYIKAKIQQPGKFPSVADKDTGNIVHGFDSVADAIKELTFQNDLNKAKAADRYKVYRKKRYEDAGLTAEAWAIAKIQAEEDNDSTELDKLKAKRAEIKGAVTKEGK